MAEQKTQMQNMSVVRYSNEESKRITRYCIETALIQLLEKEEFEKISVSEIVKRAGVSRTAFYRNYQTKEDVILSSVEDAITTIMRAMSLDPRTEQFWNTLFREIKEYIQPFQILLKAGMSSMILDQITAHILDQRKNCATIDRYSGILWAGAVYNALVTWVKEDASEPVDEMTKICMQIATFDHFDSRIKT